MSIALANPSLIGNNEPVAIVPNSLTYTEGKGEQTMRAASSGGGSVEPVYSNNVETNLSMLKFSVYNDPETIELLRDWKNNSNQNVFAVTGKTADGKTLRRTFNKAALLTDYEVNLGADTTIEVEFKSSPAV